MSTFSNFCADYMPFYAFFCAKISEAESIFVLFAHLDDSKNVVKMTFFRFVTLMRMLTTIELVTVTKSR